MSHYRVNLKIKTVVKLLFLQYIVKKQHLLQHFYEEDLLYSVTYQKMRNQTSKNEFLGKIEPQMIV